MPIQGKLLGFCQMRSEVPQAFPYQGSKRLLASKILPCIPRDTVRLVEPFAGSAAISVAAAFRQRAKSFLLNDAHAPLAALWTQIIKDASGLASGYEKIWNKQLASPRQYYDQIREQFNRTHEADLFLFLLARCVKAAIRYNSRGEFNNSPDKRRLGMKPETMRQNLVRIQAAFKGNVQVSSADYSAVLSDCGKRDVVYMDPPYQGVCRDRDARYVSGVRFDDFTAQLDHLNRRDIPFLVSYDGRTGNVSYGERLPDELNLSHFEIKAGKSTQSTLLGKDEETFEALYLSPSLVKRLGKVPSCLTDREALLFH